MGGLRKFVDKIKPTFSEGGKLSFLASTFDAFETFLFVPNTTTSRGAHIRDCNDMKRTMIVVVVALMPALLFGMYNTGYQVGMTGWAAIHGSRGPVDTPEDVRRRVELDIEYIERQSVWLDLYIIAMTIPCLLGDRQAVR